MPRPLSQVVFSLLLFVPVLLASPSPARGGDPKAAEIRRLLDDPSPSARAAALRRLAGDSSSASISLLRERLADPHPYVRRACAGVLGQLLDPARRKLLTRQIARVRTPVVRLEACRIYALWADELGLSALHAALADRAPEVRQAAVSWYARLVDAGLDRGVERGGRGDPKAGGPAAGEVWRRFTTLAKDTAPAVRAEALATLPGAFPPREREELMREGLLDGDARVRMAALEGSVAVSRRAVVFAVLHGLVDAVWSVRLAAAELSRAVPEIRVLVALVDRLEDERRCVARAAEAGLLALTGIPFGANPTRWRKWIEEDGPSFDLEGYAAAPKARAGKRFFKAGTDTVAAPRFLGLAVDSRHVAFVLDASSSMKQATADGGTRWAAMVAALKGVLRGLRAGPKAQVNVHLFAESVESLFKQAATLTPARVRQIEKYLSARGPRGRTALYDGIAAALADPTVDTVVVLSDGAPSAGSFFTKTDLLTEIALRNRWRRARIHVIAVGRDGIAKRWRDVLQRIAADSHGQYVERR